MENPAAVAYEAYREIWNATSTNSTYMVSWSHASESEKKMWWNVVRKLAAKGATGDATTRAERLMSQVMKTWNPPAFTGRERRADIAQTATMLAIAYIMGRDFLPCDLAENQRRAIDGGGLEMMIEELDEQPSLSDWIEGWEASRESGQSGISREEAERRYYQTYGRGNTHQNGEG